MASEKEFISLLNQHQKIVYKVCNLYMDMHSDREDLFQEITLQAWKAYGNFRGDAKFSTWLYRVALNTAITFFRKEKRKPDTYSTDTVPDQADESNDPIEEQVKAMYAAIGNLSKIDKAIVAVCDCGGVRSAHLLYAREAPQREVARQKKDAAKKATVKPCA